MDSLEKSEKYLLTQCAVSFNFWIMNQIEKQLIEIYKLLNQLEDEGKDWTSFYKKQIEKVFQLEQRVISGK